MLIDVPYIDQSIKYPTGCESVSAVMLLQHMGIDITVDEFINGYLELKDFYTKEGILYGANPNDHFCGSPYDSESFGCYAPVIKAALEKVLQSCGKECTVINETGKSVEYLIDKYIDKGIPVVMWACINMREPVTGPSWHLESGEEFTWVSNEHCMLLVGYDGENYIFNDPYENNGVISYNKEIVKNRHEAQGMQAVAVVQGFSPEII